MPIDPTVETDLITAKVDSAFVQPVHEGVPDGTLSTYTNGLLNPYITLDYGTPVATYGGRGLLNESTQPHSIRVIVAGVAPTSRIARRLTSKAAKALIGWAPSTNSGPLRAVGGGGYTIQFDANRPTQYVSELYLLFTSNLATPETPEPPEPDIDDEP